MDSLTQLLCIPTFIIIIFLAMEGNPAESDGGADEGKRSQKIGRRGGGGGGGRNRRKRSQKIGRRGAFATTPKYLSEIEGDSVGGRVRGWSEGKRSGSVAGRTGVVMLRHRR